LTVGQGRPVLDQPADVVVGELRQAEPARVGGIAEQLRAGLRVPQARMQVQAGAGEVPERLGHEGGGHARPVRERVHHVAEEDQPVGGRERVGESEVLLELAVRVLVVVGVVRPAELVHVPRHRGQVVEHPGQALGVVAGHAGPVERVGQFDAALVAPPDQEVLRLAAHVVDVAALARLLQHALQDQPRSVRPRLALDLDVALQHGQPRLPRRERVRRRVRRRDHVRVGRALAHRPGREAREARPAEQYVERGDRDHLGAGLPVHVHEHGEEELDAVRLCPGAKLGLNVWHMHSPWYPLRSVTGLRLLRPSIWFSTGEPGKAAAGTASGAPEDQRESGQCLLRRHDGLRVRSPCGVGKMSAPHKHRATPLVHCG
jgi:hypothetical protein